MANREAPSDKSVQAMLGERLARQRLQRNLTQAQLAKEAGISLRTLIRLESGESSQLTNLIRVIRALGLLRNLDAFVPAPVPSPVEQVRSRAKERRRASGGSKGAGPSGAWAWGDDQRRGAS